MILKPQVAPILPRQAQDERCELTEGIIDRAEFLAGCIAIAGVAREQRGAHSLQRRHPSDPRHSEQVGATACSVWSFGIQFDNSMIYQDRLGTDKRVRNAQKRVNGVSHTAMSRSPGCKRTSRRSSGRPVRSSVCFSLLACACPELVWANDFLSKMDLIRRRAVFASQRGERRRWALLMIMAQQSSWMVR